jgi:hypothetical protein
MDRIILGDNQFFAVSHLSDEKSMLQAIKFRDDASIIAVLESAYKNGINTFMCTTHDRIAGVCEHIRNNAERWRGFSICPCMPYAHKYANAVTELGMLGTIKKYVPGNFFKTFARGGMAVVKNDMEELIKLLIDAELKMFRGISMPVVFIQNVIVDMILGLKMYDLFGIYDAYIRDKYKAEPGYITMNMPALIGPMQSVGIKNPVICTSINKIGFRMPGGRDLYERILSERKCRIIAMQIFAAGAIRPEDAIEYICGLEGVESILYGASTSDHISHTNRLIGEYWRDTLRNKGG